MLISIPAFHKVTAFDDCDILAVNIVMRWVERKASAVLLTLITKASPPLPLADPATVLPDDTERRKTGCYYSMPAIRHRPIYPKLDDTEKKPTKDGPRDTAQLPTIFYTSATCHVLSTLETPNLLLVDRSSNPMAFAIDTRYASDSIPRQSGMSDHFSYGRSARASLTVNDMPEELMVEVFRWGFRAEASSLSTEWPRNDPLLHEFHPFPTILLRVCRHWTCVASANAALWTAINAVLVPNQNPDADPRTVLKPSRDQQSFGTRWRLPHPPVLQQKLKGSTRCSSDHL
ncbi:hypothetical protein NMY22_g14002 [Coprinellus aureogranulatus]|nr:hypothetical protein NMY22_g14002 [Coprinellus aureogranulatus]